MVAHDWLADWNPRYARVLAQREGRSTRAALIDTNGDGREIWFGLDVREPSGEWVSAVDWDDVSNDRPPGSVDDLPAVVGWGTGRPGEHHVIEFGGTSVAVPVDGSGWWMFLAEANEAQSEVAEATRSADEPTPAQPVPGAFMPLDRVTEADGPHRSQLSLRLANGTVLSGDAAHEYLARARARHDRT